jgi:hypothetical protein
MGWFPVALQYLPLSGGTLTGALTVQGNVLGYNLGADFGSVDVSVAGGGVKVAEGSNAKQGTAALVSGTVTVANTSVTASSRIFLTVNSPSGTVGVPYVSARTPETSFTISSSSAADDSVVAYEIFEPG